MNEDNGVSASPSIDANRALADRIEQAEGPSDALLDAVAEAIEYAQCPGREGPFGGYDYGHNSDFYGPEPKEGRYVVRDFRDPKSESWGAWVHQTHDRAEHEAAFQRLTRRHVAAAAIAALSTGASHER